MTTGIIFYAQSEELSIWSDPVAWGDTLNSYNVDFYILIDGENLVPNWNDERRENYRVNNFDDAITKLDEVHSECEKTYLSMTSETELKDYTHPSNVCYIVGPDNGEDPIFTYDSDIRLYPENLWAVQCISVTLYDRYSKE